MIYIFFITALVAAYFMVRPSLKDKSPKFEDLDD
jgi:hypothetical protein